MNTTDAEWYCTSNELIRLSLLIRTLAGTVRYISYCAYVSVHAECNFFADVCDFLFETVIKGE